MRTPDLRSYLFFVPTDWLTKVLRNRRAQRLTWWWCDVMWIPTQTAARQHDATCSCCGDTHTMESVAMKEPQLYWNSVGDGRILLYPSTLELTQSSDSEVHKRMGENVVFGKSWFVPDRRFYWENTVGKSWFVLNGFGKSWFVHDRRFYWENTVGKWWNVLSEIHDSSLIGGFISETLVVC